MKIMYFFLFLWVIFALLDPEPDPATQINADPQPWFYLAPLPVYSCRSACCSRYLSLWLYLAPVPVQWEAVLRPALPTAAGQPAALGIYIPVVVPCSSASLVGGCPRALAPRRCRSACCCSRSLYPCGSTLLQCQSSGRLSSGPRSPQLQVSLLLL